MDKRAIAADQGRMAYGVLLFSILWHFGVLLLSIFMVETKCPLKIQVTV